MTTKNKYEAIIVGGGHAGTEAAAALSRMGHKTLLVTQDPKTIGQMSCNPAIGGVGKGHLAKEIDALGGIMAVAADQAGIHFKKLNASKGRAVQATRAQADRALYRRAVQQRLYSQACLTVVGGMVSRLLLEGETIKGIATETGKIYLSRCVILTVGTFLNGKIHVGKEQLGGGRIGDRPSVSLAHQLKEIAPRVDRLKTGTPPRILKKSISFDFLEEQAGDTPRPVFSFIGNRKQHPKQVSCHLAYTNQETHHIIRNALTESPLFDGSITGNGPRYCPSIEDKVVRFKDKSRHQIFIEPEGLVSTEVYPNGISTSLNKKDQVRFVRSIEGFGSAIITKPGYAIEYDYFDPRDLRATLETKQVRGLFFAGQINGTTGYEEAAAQGVLAGINAGLKIQNNEPWTPGRDEAYIGVLSDDLVTRGTNEPYRMFTSRAEHRLLLREDNADSRLTPKGRELGVVGEERWKIFCEKRKAIEKEKQRLANIFVPLKALKRLDNRAKNKAVEKTAYDLLKRPSVNYRKLVSMPEVGKRTKPRNEKDFVAEQIQEQIETDAKYEGYLFRQKKEVKKQQTYKNTALPEDINYSRLPGLSNEAKQKLKEFSPETIGQAARIQGITPASLSVLLVHLKKRKLTKSKAYEN
ncbi:MAG: tRNA uridine-5-carboxymethylaminomethyl(34) synthesis enzyme MnmG [Gammaproteobacteria bacterium]|nr:tRNA uridine-5-carboxymethylaminomethyl(34) synthesis enzyme MnmG [Gammaproteobacteria bacterium]